MSERQPIITEAEGTQNNNNNPKDHDCITDKGPPMKDQQAAANNETPAKETSREQNKGETNRMTHYTFWLMLFTGVLAVATIFLAISTCFLWYYAGQQSKDMKASIAVAQKSIDVAESANKLNRDIFAIRERPWLKILDVKLNGPNPIIFAGDGINLYISYQVKNVGTTPAADVKFWFEAIIMDSDKDMKIPEKLRNVCIKKKGEAHGATVVAGIVGHLFPNETSIENSILMFIPIIRFEQQIGRKIDSFKSILIIAYVTYKFPFDDTIHITGAPYLLSRKELAPIFPVQKDDPPTGDGKAHRIMADKLNFSAIWYSYAD